MLPYILIAAGLGLLLTMLMYMRLAKRQETVQRGLYDIASANETAMASVSRQAAEASSAVRESAEQFQSSLAAQQPLVQEARSRIEGVEARFATFEDRLTSMGKRSLEGVARTRAASEETAKTLESLQDEAKTLGAAVQSLRNTSDQRLAEDMARMEKLEATLGLGGTGSRGAAAKPKKASPPKPDGSQREPC